MIDIKKELYHARLIEELKQRTLIIEELKEVRTKMTDPGAITIINSLILKHNNQAAEVRLLINKCIKSVLKK